MTAFVTWLSTYGSVIGFFVQIAFYIVVAVAALWSTLLFKRLVESRTASVETVATAGTGGSAEIDQPKDTPSVDDFVD